MRYIERIAMALSAVLCALLAGCAATGGFGTVHDPAAFGKGKTYAVVSVMAYEKVQCSDLGGNPCNGGVIGLVKTMTDAKAFSEDAGEALEMTYAAALQGLRASPNIRLAPDVRNSRAYRALAEDAQPTGMMSARHVVAKGYKYLSHEKLAGLAKELKVDGVITVTLSYSAKRSGVSIAGFGGGHKASTTMYLAAVDKNGKNVWVDYATGDSDGTVGTVTASPDFVKLRPLFRDATTKATRKLIDSFDAKTKL
jgi:hypothetical protein